MKYLLAFFLGLLAFPTLLFAQVPRSDWIDQVRADFRPTSLVVSRSSLADEEVGSFRWLEFTSSSSWLPEHALGGMGNDGAAWQGRGFNTLLTGGLWARWEFLTFTFEPQVAFASNLSFDPAPSTLSQGWGDYGAGIDRLQRYGTDPLVHFDWGNTALRAAWGPWTLGLGTEALWLGGGEHNAVLLSDNAGGFPHIDLGTSRPWKTDWGTFQGTFLWGALYNSDVYRGNPWSWAADTRFLHALVVGYSPPFLEHFTVGAARFFVSPWTTVNLWKAFQSVDDALFKATRGADLDGTQGEDDVDQTAALYFDFNLPDQGFHAYAEIARNDHAWDWRDLMAQPDHSLGYVLGVRQVVKLPSVWSAYAAYEQADLGFNYGTVVRPTGSWYRRWPGDPGYTLGGQLLGAAIGPGSNSNDLEVGVVYDNLSLGLAFKRVAFDVDYLVTVVKPPVLEALLYYDVLTLISLKAGWHANGFKLNVEVGEAVEYGRHWTPLAPIKGWFGSVQMVFQP